MSEINSQFYLDSASAWEAMLADIEKATVSIDIERYIFICDSIGQRFVDACIRRAKAGVRVRILCDMTGSLSFYLSQVPQELSRLGIQVQFFNPISLWRIGNFSANFFRDHRKLILVDGAIGYIGGVGIQAGMANWRDTEVRIEGPLVKNMEYVFEHMWLSTIKRKFIPVSRAPLFVKNFEIVTNSPRFSQRFLYRDLIAAVRNARSSIYLTTPYFVPDLRLLRVMRLAARRGVDVRLLVPEYGDHYFVTSARQSYFTILLKSGIKIYRYQGRMMHTKTVVIDDEWGTLGSFNLDSLSFLFNYEANLISSDKEFVGQLKDQFLNDLTSSQQIVYSDWIRRPLLHKIKEIITWPFHKIL